MTGGGPFGLPPGYWTDDTSMALCLAESLLECGGFDPVDQLERYRRWWREGHLSSTGQCFDIGNTCRAALARFERTREPWCGPTSPDTAGNGSLMRLAPVPMFYAADRDAAVRFAGESSRTTHGARTAVDACRWYAAPLVAALDGASKADILAQRVDGLAPEIKEIAAGSYALREPPYIAGTGYVVKSLEAALWAFHRMNSFRDVVLAAANLGDDADTTAAICGQLAGAHYGLAGIPPEWLDKLHGREMIFEMADRLSTRT